MSCDGVRSRGCGETTLFDLSLRLVAFCFEVLVLILLFRDAVPKGQDLVNGR